MGKVRRSRKVKYGQQPPDNSSSPTSKGGSRSSTDKIDNSKLKLEESPADTMKSKPGQFKAPASIKENPFSNTKISLSMLKTHLNVPSQEVDDDRMSFVSKGSLRGGKEQLKKKDRMKLRRQRWMEKLATIDKVRTKRKERVKRLKTPVVGDLEPMMSALPELSEILKLSEEAGKRADKRRQTLGSKTKKSTMKAKHRQKLLNRERKQFQQVLQHSAFKDDPFGAVNKHLAIKLQQEESSTG